MNYNEILEYIATDINIMFKIHRFINKQNENERKLFLDILYKFTYDLGDNKRAYVLFEYIYNTFQNRDEVCEKLSFDDILFLLHVIYNRDGIQIDDLNFLKKALSKNRDNIYQYIISNDRKFKFNKKLNNN
jgi:hypothetical protein